jgi:hypothetical protein
MSEYTFAFITPSYAPDFQRCKLLCWSIKQFVLFPIKHYIIVDKKDLALFQELSDSNTIILTKEEIFPSWIKCISFRYKKNLWLNLKGFKSGNWLLRGWLIQQIVKLSAARYVEQEILVFVDSDVAFIDYFDVHSLVHEDKVRLFRVEHSTDMDSELSRKWKDTAVKLLGLPLTKNYHDFYIHQIVSWKRDNLLRLYELIEKNFSQDWLEVIAGVKDLSEYILYGIFSNHVMAENSGHYYDCQQRICWCYWEDQPMSDEDLKIFFQEAQSSGHKAVMISAKSSIDLSVEQFQKYLSTTPAALVKSV